MEALILILIVSITFVSFAGVVAQGLKIAARSRDLTEGLLWIELLIFEMENGLRPDLVIYGGRGRLKGDSSYEIRIEEEKGFYERLQGKFVLSREADSLDFDFFMYQGAPE